MLLPTFLAVRYTGPADCAKWPVIKGVREYKGPFGDIVDLVWLVISPSFKKRYNCTAKLEVSSTRLAVKLTAVASRP